MSATENFNYSQIRLAWLKTSLKNFVRRWAIYVAIGLAVLGGGFIGMVALAAWSVTPIFYAPLQSMLICILISLGYGVLGGIVVFGLSPLLLPRKWIEIERCLPIEASDRLRSDLTVVCLGLTPLLAIYFLGTVIWLVKFPFWLQEIWVKSISVLLASIGISFFLGHEILKFRRGTITFSNFNFSFRIANCLPGYLSDKHAYLSYSMALVVLPLIRGTANRSARLFGLILTVLVGSVVILLLFPKWASWTLVTFAVLSQIMVTRLNVVVKEETAHLVEGCAFVPISPNWIKKALRVLVMLPLLLGIVILMIAIIFGGIPVKLMVLSIFLLFIFLGNLSLVVASSNPPSLMLKEDPIANVSWWLLTLLISVALATEVVR